MLGDDGTKVPRSEGDHAIVVPAKLKARGVELRFILHADDGGQRPAPDFSLILAIMRGHHWYRRMMAPDRPTMSDIPAADGVSHH